MAHLAKYLLTTALLLNSAALAANEDFSGRPPLPPPGTTTMIGIVPVPIPARKAPCNVVAAVQLKPDAVPLHRYRNGKAVRLDVYFVEGEPLTMLLDTGATMSQIPKPLADRLVAAKRAKVTGSANVLLADGSTHLEQVLTIDTVVLGRHTIHGMMVTVTVSGDAILGFPPVDGIAPFTIDTRAGQLVFHGS